MKYIILVLSILLLVSCSSNVSRRTYRNNYANIQENIVEAVIISMIPTKFDNKAIENPALFNRLDTNVTGTTEKAIIDRLEKEPIDTQQEMKFTLRKKDGSLTSVVQTNELGLQVGQHVLVVYSDKIHLIPDTRLKT